MEEEDEEEQQCWVAVEVSANLVVNFKVWIRFWFCSLVLVGERVCYFLPFYYLISTYQVKQVR